jgi:hypothetical protein
MKTTSPTADLLADIGAVDASLMSLPLEDIERMQFFVEQRDRLLAQLSEALPHASASPSNLIELEEIRRRTFVLSGRLNASRELVLDSLRQVGESLQALQGYGENCHPDGRVAENTPGANGQLVSSIA